jgi:CheY-like chemotaxis protein
MFTQQQLSSIPPFPSFGEPKDIPSHLFHRELKHDDLDKGRKVRIIVVDDEALIADTVVEILKEEGFEATGVSTGTSAIELARDWQPDIVLSDVILPGLNGIEIGVRIREMVPNCRIILFSGQAATLDLLEKAREQGHKFDILAKPIKPEKLVHLIRGHSNLPS